MWRYATAALFLLFCLSGCWIEAADQHGGGDTDTTAVFKDMSSTNIPVDNLSGNSMDAKATDVDADGDLDLIIAVEFNPNKILINNGSGVFTDESDDRLPAKNYDSEDIAVADFDGDGTLDIVFVSLDDQVNEYYLNNGDGTFRDVSGRLPVTGKSNAILAYDLSGDSAPDLIIGNNGQNNILINNGQGYFGNASGSRLPQINDITQDLQLGDIDGDGDADLLIANEDDNRLLLNTGNGFFIDRTHTRLPLIGAIEETRDINITDVNGDAELDLYFGNVILYQSGSNAQDRLLINNQGSFTDETSTKLPSINTNTVEADFFDIDDDNDPDILVGDWGSLDNQTGNYSGSNFMRILINNGGGSFSDTDRNYLPQNFSPAVTDFEVADFNNDGLSDIYIANYGTADVLLIWQI